MAVYFCIRTNADFIVRMNLVKPHDDVLHVLAILIFLLHYYYYLAGSLSIVVPGAAICVYIV